MKSKLTLTVDETLIPRAKRLARERRVSLSELVESQLAALCDEARSSTSTFVNRWSGKFELNSSDDSRAVRLRAKYDR